MKRAFPQKVKPVPSYITENDVVADQSKQACSEVNRRSRTSAAMIGLAAISMGAHGLLMAHQADEAIAAEPVAEEPSSANPAAFDVATVSSGEESPSSGQALAQSGGNLVEHTVQEGETIWQLAEFYGADAVKLAALNGIPLNAVLRVGQVLKVPADNRVASAATPDSSTQPLPGYYGLVERAEVESPSSVEVTPRDESLKARQEQTLEVLRQKRETLRASLSKAKSVSKPDLLPEPSERSEPQTGAAAGSYRVVAGDTLGAIAKSHGVSLRALVDANSLSNPNVIRVNQVLVIPQGEFTSSSLSSGATAQSPTVPNLIAMTPDPVQSGVPVITSSTGSDVSSVSIVNEKFQKSTQPGFQARVASVPAQAEASQSQGMGGSTESDAAVVNASTQVATAPYVNNQPGQAEETASNPRYSYVENLRLEIVKLREKYKQSSTTSLASAQADTRVATATLSSIDRTDAASRAVNPEFSSSSDRTDAMRAQVRRLQAKSSRSGSVGGSASGLAAPTQPQLVATAPLGSESYEPLLPSSLGKMVSPDLPPLGSVDSYLPSNSGKFNGYIWPAKGLLTSGYGWRWGRMHKGIDIAAPTGTPVVAAATGTVVTAGWNSGGYGNMVEIQHSDGSVTLYAHNNRILVREGQQVEQGEQIAEMGSTGYSTGPHSHFEVHLPGHGAVNPMAYLPRAGA